MDMIDDYNEDILFGTLAEALSKREVPAQLDGEERMDYIEAQYDKYMKEFDENGFDNISVDTGEKDMRTVKV
jgi:phosphosulfolactate synthase (CoM biosynthesis protein A)